MQKVVSGILLDIAHERNGYSIGEPWRFTQHSLAAVVPLVRVNNTPSRAYRLLAERKDEVKVKDTGNIELLQLVNTGEYPVLVKAGEVLVGATQSRILTVSQVVMAGEKVDVACACVHSSQGIREGQGMTPGIYSPLEVRRAVYHGHYSRQGSLSPSYLRDQSSIWGSVNSYARSAAGRTHSLASMARTADEGTPVQDFMESLNPTYHTPSEDLAGRVSEAQTKYEDILKQVPKTDHQVGMALLAMNGLESLETFEHPDSWEGMRRAILGAESDKISDISDQNGVFEFRPEKAKDIIRELLSGEFGEKVALERAHTQTVILDAKQFVGEVVTLDDVPIHCAFVRKAS